MDIREPMDSEALFDFGEFPTLETPRLYLRELAPADAPAVFAIRGDYEVTKYNGGANYTRLDQAVALIRGIANDYRDKRSIRWGITLRHDPKHVIGMCGYNYWLRKDARASIGYDLARAHWGKGIMPEAIRAIIEFGFQRMGLKRIEADASADNARSVRVLEKLGFQREGVQHEQFYEESESGDLILFSLLRRDYRPPAT